MGLETSGGAKSIWLKIVEGKLYQQSDKEKESPFNAISGIITGMYFKEEKWEDSVYETLNIQIRSGEDKFILSIRVESGYFASFMNFVGTVDLSQEVRINPSVTTNDQGKKRSTLFVSQNGKAKNRFTKDSPDGPPSFKQVTVGKKTMWDTTEFTEFWKKFAETLVFSKQEPIAEKPEPTQLAKKAEPVVENPVDDYSDLPF